MSDETQLTREYLYFRNFETTYILTSFIINYTTALETYNEKFYFELQHVFSLSMKKTMKYVQFKLLY
jgi:hypothetical protein